MEKVLFENLTQEQKIEQLDMVGKGRYVRIKWYSLPKLKKEYNGRVRKETSSVVRLGVNYSNLQENDGKEIQARPSSLKWYYKNIVLQNVNTNTLNVQVYTSKVKTHKSITQYFLDGEPITKQELIDMGALSPSQAKSFDGNTFMVKLDNIISIG